MNLSSKPPGASWKADDLSAAEKAAFVRRGVDRADAIAGTQLSFRRLALGIGLAGTVIGVLGIGAAAAVILTWRPAEVVFNNIDRSTGEITPAPRGLAVTENFTEGTVRQHLRMYLDYCEAYIYSTFAGTSRRCQLFLNPRQQTLFAESVAASNAAGPQARFGRTGFMSIADRVEYTPSMQARDGTQVWTIDFMRIEGEPNKQATCTPMKAHITFRWLPDLPMNAGDREINLGGMQIAGRRVFPDPTRTRC